MKRLPLSTTSRRRPIRLLPGVDRSGATLSEALVALLVMAIGVISLAALFPIAVLKTARANQLTSATNIRYNAESMMKVYPWIFSDPNPADTGPNGIPDGIPFNDYDFSQGRAFLFDPLGCVGAPERPDPLPGAPGYLPAGGGMGLLPRYGGGFNGSLAAADTICSGLDTWSLLNDGPITNVNAAFTQIDVSNLSTLTTLQWPGANRMRVQIFYNGGKSSLTRMVTALSPSNQLIFTEDINGNSMLDPGEDQNGNSVLDDHALPATITYESARLESRERRYSWLLTVRPQDVGASFVGGLGAKPSFDVTVVVYFGRSFSPADEVVYGTLPPAIPAVSNLSAGSTVNQFNDGSRVFSMSWAATSDAPHLKRGGWVLDVINGYWYQIENFTDTTGVTSSTITLASNILETSSMLVVPRGVVDVFPIAPQTP